MPRNEIEVLEDHAYARTVLSKRFALDMRDIAIVERDRPSRWLEEAIEATQERRFTATRETDDD
jgi:hypothetical protein